MERALTASPIGGVRPHINQELDKIASARMRTSALVSATSPNLLRTHRQVYLVITGICLEENVGCESFKWSFMSFKVSPVRRGFFKVKGRDRSRQKSSPTKRLALPQRGF
jgi:hypothetical protein